MTPPTKKYERLLLKCSAVLQVTVIISCILVMMLFPDFRFHPMVVLCYAAAVLFSNLSRWTTNDFCGTEINKNYHELLTNNHKTKVTDNEST